MNASPLRFSFDTIVLNLELPVPIPVPLRILRDRAMRGAL